MRARCVVGHTQVVNSRGDVLDHDRQNLIPALERSQGDTCAFGQQLANDMNAMRIHLLHHQPPNHPDVAQWLDGVDPA